MKDIKRCKHLSWACTNCEYYGRCEIHHILQKDLLFRNLTKKEEKRISKRVAASKKAIATAFKDIAQ